MLCQEIHVWNLLAKYPTESLSLSLLSPPLRFILFDSFNWIRSFRVMHFDSSLQFTYHASVHSLRFIRFNSFTSSHSLRFISLCSLSLPLPYLIHICRYVRGTGRCVVAERPNQRRLLDHHRSNLSLYLSLFSLLISRSTPSSISDRAPKSMPF
jgi:hypothetical protein